MAEADYYLILGLDENAGPEDIRAAYHKLAQRYHPDRSAGNDQADRRFMLVAEAYSVLSDPVKRPTYDRELAGIGLPKSDSGATIVPATPEPAAAEAAPAAKPPPAAKSPSQAPPTAKATAQPPLAPRSRQAQPASSSSTQAPPGAKPPSAPSGMPPPRQQRTAKPGSAAPDTAVSGTRPAYLYERMAALLADVLVWLAAAAVSYLALSRLLAAANVPTDANTTGSTALALLFVALVFIAPPVYLVWCWVATGETLGCQLLGIRVLRADGQPLDLGTAVKRLAIAVVSTVPLGLGVWCAAWDPHKLAWYDRSAGTIVRRDAAL